MGLTWSQLSPVQRAVLAEAADDLEVEIWELAAPVRVFLIGGKGSILTDAYDIDVVRAAVRFLLDQRLVALGRRTGRNDLAALQEGVLDDPRTWEPRTGRDLMIYTTELGDELYDEVLPRPKGT